MSLDWSRFAGATLALAVGLVIAAAVAWVVAWGLPEEQERWARVAREHLAPLSEWALGALALHALALVLAGDAGLGPWALVALLAGAAALLRQPPSELEPDPAAEPVKAAPAPERAPHSTLWARQPRDER